MTFLVLLFCLILRIQVKLFIVIRPLLLPLLLLILKVRIDSLFCHEFSFYSGLYEISI